MGVYGKNQFAANPHKDSEAFVYGKGWVKIKKSLKVKAPEEFNYASLKEINDKYGFDVLCRLLNVSYQDMATRYAYRSLEIFMRGEAYFNKFQKMWDACQSLRGMLNSKWGFDEVIGHDVRCYSYTSGEAYGFGWKSVNPYYYIENSISIFSLGDFVFDSISFDIVLRGFIESAFLQGAFNHPEMKKIGDYEDGFKVRFPKEFSTLDLCDWVFGNGGGKLVQESFFGR